MAAFRHTGLFLASDSKVSPGQSGLGKTPTLTRLFLHKAHPNLDFRYPSLAGIVTAEETFCWGCWGSDDE